MINRALHQTNFITILKEIYSDPEIRTALGFKGGTAAMFFYDLPRFSVDLVFLKRKLVNRRGIGKRENGFLA